MGRVLFLNATSGDLASLFQPAEATTRNILQHRLSSAIQERLSTQEQRRRGPASEDESAEILAQPSPQGEPGS
jgi:hypothetical protein